MASGALRWFLTRETLSQKNRWKNDTIKITSEPFTFFPFYKGDVSRFVDFVTDVFSWEVSCANCGHWTASFEPCQFPLRQQGAKCQQREMAPRGVSDQIGFSLDWRGMKYLNKGEKAREDFLFRCYNLSPGIGWEGWSGLRPAGGAVMRCQAFVGDNQTNKLKSQIDWC